MLSARNHCLSVTSMTKFNNQLVQYYSQRYPVLRIFDIARQLLRHMADCCYSASVWVQSIGMSMSGCLSLSVCLSVYLSTRISQKPHVQTSPTFLSMLPMDVARSFFSGVGVCCVFPVLWMTSCFIIMGSMSA